MENEPGILRIGIPTGFGTNGIRKEALMIAKQMLSEMTSEPIHQEWCKYHIPEPDPNRYTYFTRARWGMVLTAKVDNLDYCKAIMLDFEYDYVVQLESEIVKDHSDGLRSYLKHHLVFKRRSF